MTLNLQEGRFGIKELKNSYLILYSLLQWETTNCHNTGVITYANEHLHQRLYLEDGDGSSDLWSFFRKENSSVLWAADIPRSALSRKMHHLYSV